MEQKELKDKVRALLSNRKGDRETYLAYAFVRGVPYSVVEERINEDNFDLPLNARANKQGLFAFLSGLAQSVSVVIEKVEYPENKVFGYPGKRFDQVYQWMLEKYPVAKISESNGATANMLAARAIKDGSYTKKQTNPNPWPHVTDMSETQTEKLNVFQKIEGGIAVALGVVYNLFRGFFSKKKAS